MLGLMPSGTVPGSLDVDNGLMVTVPAVMLEVLQQRSVSASYIPEQEALVFDWAVSARQKWVIAGVGIGALVLGLTAGIFWGRR